MEDNRSIPHSFRHALRGDISGLPPAPMAAIKLLRLTNDASSTSASLSRVIETEPALAAKILRIANSAYYGFAGRIATLSRAITLLGFATVRRETLHLLLFDSLSSWPRASNFDRMQFWRHSLHVAILSRLLARQLNHPSPDALYAAGLLHDVGKLILECYGKIRYGEFLSTIVREGTPSPEFERPYFGLSHDELGAGICAAWGFPEVIWRVQALHHSPLDGLPIDPQHQQNAAIVATADFISWTQGTSATPAYSPPRLHADVTERVDLQRLNLAHILDSADQELQHIGQFYGLRLPRSSQVQAHLITALACIHSPAQQNPRQSSLTMPHRSLEPGDFVPATLASIAKEFPVDRLFLLQIKPEQRRLVIGYRHPPSPDEPHAPLPLSPGLIQSLRERSPRTLRHERDDTPLLQHLNTDSAVAIPVTYQRRPLGALILYHSQQSIAPIEAQLPELALIAHELGVALENSRQFLKEREKALFDGLTRLHNRGALDRFVEHAFTEERNGAKPVAAGLVDIDHFKSFNDHFGHQVGDQVLRIVADTMRGLTRPGDFLGRYGGEEFLFVLVDTDLPGAFGYAERIRREIERRGRILLSRYPDHPITVSIGVAEISAEFADAAQWVKAADTALYEAKRAGRNRTHSHQAHTALG